jgi:regulatory protein
MFDNEHQKPAWSKNEAIIQIRKYCALQERCHQEVRYKLMEHHIYGDALEEIISDMISNNFLDEERFARSFARGKFRIKNWGKIKIKQELSLRNVSTYSIKAAMEEIDDQAYITTLTTLLTKKGRLIHDKNPAERFKKLCAYAQSKGYEFHVIQQVLDKNQNP